MGTRLPRSPTQVTTEVSATLLVSDSAMVYFILLFIIEIVSSYIMTSVLKLMFFSLRHMYT